MGTRKRSFWNFLKGGGPPVKRRRKLTCEESSSSNTDRSYNCPKCTKDTTGTTCIQCESCKNWYQNNCLSLTKEHISTLSNEQYVYYCEDCRIDHFDFSSGLVRLKNKYFEKIDLKTKTLFEFESLISPDIEGYMARHKKIPNFSSEMIDKINENFLNFTNY